MKRELKEKTVVSTKEEQEYYCNRLAKMIACKTVSVKGEFHEEEFLKLRNVLKELFPNVHKVGEITYFGEDCYVYKIAGRDKDRNVMLMSHHDVVEATGDWKYPPFEGKLIDGCIWGRGTVDTKTPLFAEFSALEELLIEGYEFPCNVYLISSNNEEIAGDGVPLVCDYFTKEKIYFDWILDEGGAVIDPPMSGLSCKCAMIAVHEKGRYTLRIKATSNKGHSSLAGQGKTPAVRMAALIMEMENKQPFIRNMYPEVQAMFKDLSRNMTFPMKLILGHANAFKGLLKRVIPALNAQAGSMLGTTCSFKNIQTTTQGDCTAEVFFRCVKDEDLKKDLETFRKIAMKYNITFDQVLEDEYYKPASLSSEGYQFIKRCVEEYFDYAACAPFILPAGTDARHFSNLSDAVIRFAPIDINQQQYGSVHNTNENISMDAVVRAVKFYKTILQQIRII